MNPSMWPSVFKKGMRRTPNSRAAFDSRPAVSGVRQPGPAAQGAEG